MYIVHVYIFRYLVPQNRHLTHLVIVIDREVHSPKLGTIFIKLGIQIL